MRAPKPRTAKSASALPATPATSARSGSYFGQPQPAQEKREKVTVSVNASLLATVDDFVGRHAKTNRSAVIDQALNMWCLWLQEQEDKAYYTNLTAAERAERKGWTDAAAQSATESWDK